MVGTGIRLAQFLHDLQQFYGDKLGGWRGGRDWGSPRAVSARPKSCVGPFRV